MLSTQILETRGAKLIAAVAVTLVLAAASAVLLSVSADALPCDPTRQECPAGGGQSTIRVTLNVTNSQAERGRITSSDGNINCGMGSTDCSQTYQYIVQCDEFGECTTPDYRTVSLTPTAASGFAFSGWGGACSGTGSCFVTMDNDKTVSASFADTQNPTVSLTSPATNAVVRGTMNISATASDNVAVSQVTFSYDGSFVQSDTSPPYGVSVDSATRRDGRRVVSAQAVDTAGRTSTAIRSVIVDNLAPAVLDTAAGLEPDRGMTNASRIADISAAFSEEMSPATLTPSTIKLQSYSKKRGWKTVPTTIGFGDANTRVILDPFGATEVGSEKALGARKKHRVIVTTGVQDIAAHAMDSKFTWNFKTGV